MSIVIGDNNTDVDMIDKWFIEDIVKCKKQSDIVVVLDRDKKSTFLIDLLDEKSVVSSNDDWSELLARQQLYGVDSTNQIVLHVCRDRKLVKFTQEYIQTKPMINLSIPERYIKDKIQQELGLNINVADDMLLTLAKNSVGKDKEYWLDVIHKNKVIDIKESILPFLDNPDLYIKTLEEDQHQLFLEGVYDMLDTPIAEKPNKTLAKEVANFIFNNLTSSTQDNTATAIYDTWVDSHQYRSSLDNYISSYKIKSNDIWQFPSNHPFPQVDKQQLLILAELVETGKSYDKYLDQIKLRSLDPVADSIGVTYWKSFLDLISYKEHGLGKINNLVDAIEYHINKIVPIDLAIRNLYTAFLKDKDVIIPLQHIYHQHIIAPFLEVWFRYFDDYTEEQTGTISKLISKANVKTAIVVADGMSYDSAVEMSQYITNAKLVTNHIKVGIPSETEHNMSLIYDKEGVITPVHKEREKKLAKEFSSIKVGFELLESITQHTDDYDHIICTFKDIDELGEKSQQRYLKFTKSMFEMASTQIARLIEIGYEEVHLITDHGFVLTGILSEAEKIVVDLKGDSKTGPRYIKSVKHPENNDLHTEERKYGKYNFISFARSIAPFKSKGAYGYSHGGITPQELITPHFIWSANTEYDNDLSIVVMNKEDLNSVLGDNFDVILKASASKNGKSISRSIDIKLYYQGELQYSVDAIHMKADSQCQEELSFDGKKQLDLQVLDHSTKETLTKITINKDTSRDLGLF